MNRSIWSGEDPIANEIRKEEREARQAEARRRDEEERQAEKTTP